MGFLCKDTKAVKITFLCTYERHTKRAPIEYFQYTITSASYHQIQSLPKFQVNSR